MIELKVVGTQFFYVRKDIKNENKSNKKKEGYTIMSNYHFKDRE